MENGAGAGIVGILAGALFAFFIAGGSLVIAPTAKPHVWPQILIFVWAVPLALAGFSAGAEIADILLARYFSRDSTWQWLKKSPKVEMWKSHR
jgi:hypothetical protein